MEKEIELSIPCKVVLVGSCKKNGIICIYISQNFSSQLSSTPASNYTIKTIYFPEEKKSIKFEIWDTAGQKEYRSLAKITYKSASVIILVYDITNRNSFEDLKNYWIDEIKNKKIYNYLIYSFCYCCK